MIKKIILISTLVLFGNTYCMKQNDYQTAKDPNYESDTDDDSQESYSDIELDINIPNIIGEDITIKEAQLYKTGQEDKQKTYLILLSTAGKIFVYKTNPLEPQKTEITKSLLSLRFSSIFNEPVWRHIAAPITYKDEKDEEDYLPIATDHDVYLAKISVQNHNDNEPVLSLDITKKIITHNTPIYTVQSFNKECVISSSTYPTTKFWHSDENKNKDDLPGHMLLGGDTEVLYFVKDQYQKENKWQRWQSRNNKEREGSIAKLLYKNLSDMPLGEPMQIPFLKPNSILATHLTKIGNEITKHTCLLLNNTVLYLSKDRAPIQEYLLPEEFLSYVDQSMQLHITIIEKNKSPDTAMHGSDLKQYAMAVTQKAIYLWQLDLQETTYENNFYQIDLSKEIGEGFTIQKTILDDQKNILYIIYNQNNICKLYAYNIPKNYNALKKENKFKKVANTQNESSKTSSKTVEHAQKPKKPLYSDIFFVKSSVDTRGMQYRAEIIVEITDQTNKKIEAPLTFVNNIAITPEYAAKLHKKLGTFSFDKIDKKPDTHQTIYFTSQDEDTIIIHFLGDKNSSNYAELAQKEPKKYKANYAITQFSLQQIVGVDENYIEIQVKEEKTNQEIKAALDNIDNEPIYNPDNFIKQLQPTDFKYLGIKYKNNKMVLDWNDRSKTTTILIKKLFFTDAAGNHIHVTQDPADYKWRARYFTKEYLDTNPLEKYSI